MQALRLNKTAMRVVLLQTSAAGDVTPVTLYDRKKDKKKKKSSPGMRAPTAMLQRMINAQRAFADTLASRTTASRQKKADGLLRDLGNNVLKAINSGRKKLRLERLPI